MVGRTGCCDVLHRSGIVAGQGTFYRLRCRRLRGFAVLEKATLISSEGSEATDGSELTRADGGSGATGTTRVQANAWTGTGVVCTDRQGGQTSTVSLSVTVAFTPPGYFGFRLSNRPPLILSTDAKACKAFPV